MARPYLDFDFTVVDDRNFREDSVPEVLLVPLLSSLGFTEKEPYRIIRSRPIKHPYVYIGTAKKRGPRRCLYSYAPPVAQKAP